MKFLLAVVCACAIITDIFSWPVAQSRRDLVHLFKASRQNGPPPNGAQNRTPPPNHGFRPPHRPAGDRLLTILDEVEDKLKEFDLDACLPEIADVELRDGRPDRPLPDVPPQAFLTLLRCKAIEKGLLPEARPCIGVLPVLPAACLVTVDDIVEALNDVANEVEPMGPPAEFLWFEQFMEKVEDNLGREDLQLCIPRPTVDLTGQQGGRPAPPAFMAILMCKAIENKLMPGNHTCPDPLPALPDDCPVQADDLIALVEEEVSNVQEASRLEERIEAIKDENDQAKQAIFGI